MQFLMQYGWLTCSAKDPLPPEMRLAFGVMKSLKKCAASIVSFWPMLIGGELYVYLI